MGTRKVTFDVPDDVDVIDVPMQLNGLQIMVLAGALLNAASPDGGAPPLVQEIANGILPEIDTLLEKSIGAMEDAEIYPTSQKIIKEWYEMRSKLEVERVFIGGTDGIIEA